MGAWESKTKKRRHGARLAALLGVLVTWLPVSWAQVPGSAEYQTYCASCHQLPVCVPVGEGRTLCASYTTILPSGGLGSGSELFTTISGFSLMDSVQAELMGLAPAARTTVLDNMAGYLRAVRDGVVASGGSAIGTGSTLSFAAPIDGAAAQRSITLSNLRGTALPFSATLSGTRAADFELSSSCGTLVPASASGAAVNCTLTVTFRPSNELGAGARAATLTIDVLAANGLDPVARAINLQGDALAPIALNVATLTFVNASTTVSSAAQTVQITDRVGSGLRVCRAGTGSVFDAPGDFTQSLTETEGTCARIAPTSVLPRTVPVDVRFLKTADGPRLAALTVQRVDGGGNAIGAALSVALQGNAGPVARVDRASLFDAAGDPGVEVDNANVLERSVTVSSRGNQALSLSAFTVNGAHASDYAVAGGTCVSSPLLPAFTGDPAPSCEVMVRFDPSDVGARSASLRIASSAGEIVVALNGTGIRGPRLAVDEAGLPLASGTQVDFGTQTVAGIYRARTFTLRNGGTQGDLTVTLPAAAAIPGFTLAAQPACATLAPGATCAIDVGFNAVAVQPYAADLVIRTAASATGTARPDFTLALRGQGTAAAVPVLAWRDLSGTAITGLDFGTVDAGAVGERTIRLHNDGPGGVLVQLLNLVGADAAQFSLDAGTCLPQTNLYQLESCLVTVRFAPGLAGPRLAALQVVTSGSPPAPVTVSGVGNAAANPPLLQAAPAAVAFGLATVGGRSEPRDVVLRSAGSSALAVTALQVSGPFEAVGTTCAALPFTLPPGAECRVSLAFKPMAAGAATGALRVTHDASGAPLDVALSGDGDRTAEVSSGGCSVSRGTSPVDPALWLMVLAAMAVIGTRARRRRVEGRR